ncbi:hypothetical protein MXM56_22150, partial [Klebsiella michiganensis]|uniref:hypothetical protein n=1 Tax=Klebsiella michiganensis TaxID=1134687 RepID=UPI002DB6CFCD
REEDRNKTSCCAPSPEAGYRSADGYEPVARLSAAPPGKSRTDAFIPAHSPGCGAARLTRATDPQTAMSP